MPNSPRPFLPVLRELVRTYQLFERVSGNHVRSLGLTPPQFDVIATLGNTPGMSCKQLSEKTLITKGTLTGVIDRLLNKGLVSRTVPDSDRRSVFVALTEAGDSLFRRVFPAHLDYMALAFQRFDAAELNDLETALARLRQVLEQTKGSL